MLMGTRCNRTHSRRGVIPQCNGCAWSLYGCLQSDSCDDRLRTAQPTNRTDHRPDDEADRFARVADTVFRDDLGSDSSGGHQYDR